MEQHIKIFTGTNNYKSHQEAVDGIIRLMMRISFIRYWNHVMYNVKYKEIGLY